jgi:protein-tyrosine-phosphatase
LPLTPALREDRAVQRSPYQLFSASPSALLLIKLYPNNNKPKLVTSQMVREADMIIVMGCSAKAFCPAPLLHKAIYWGIEDPKGKPIEEIREIRDEIENRVRMLLNEAI